MVRAAGCTCAGLRGGAAGVAAPVDGAALAVGGSAVGVALGGGWSDGLAGPWLWLVEAAGENRTSAAAGVIDGGTFRRRILVGGVDV